MSFLKRSFILLLCATVTGGVFHKDIFPSSETKGKDFYKNILMEMWKQKAYEGVLIAHRMKTPDPRLEAIYTLPTPKIILAHQGDFYYKRSFNSDIVAVVVMEYEFAGDLWKDFTNTLNFMRQIRILMIFINPFRVDSLQHSLLVECEKSKITNMLVHFLNTSSLEEPSNEYYLLSPYPNYHLQLQQFDNANEYFLPDQLDMKGKALITLPSQNSPRSVMYQNRNGELKFSGFICKIIELFGQVYNGTYKLLYQPQFDEVIHQSILANMTKHGVLDLPMSVAPLLMDNNSVYLSYPVEFSKWITMVPCAKPMQINEVYAVLFSPDLILIFVGSLLLFSCLHTIIERLFYQRMIWLNLLMSDKVLPGLMAQSVVVKKTKLVSLSWIYVLIFVLGLFMSSTYSAHLQTLLMRPPFRRQIQTFEDVHASGLKILFNQPDLKYLEGDDYIFEKGIKRVLEFTNDSTKFSEYRNNFNATYAYTVTSALWDLFTFVQNAYAVKKFCTTVNLTITDSFLLSMPLELHSPYVMPLNDLVHRVHDSGLLYIWQLQTISDLLKLKKISLRDASRIKTYEDLSQYDLLYVWLILVFGLISSLLVFIVEIIADTVVQYLKKLGTQHSPSTPAAGGCTT